MVCHLLTYWGGEISDPGILLFSFICSKAAIRQSAHLQAKEDTKGIRSYSEIAASFSLRWHNGTQDVLLIYWTNRVIESRFRMRWKHPI